MSASLPVLESLSLPKPYKWVRKLEGQEWWVAAAIYPDLIVGEPLPGDRVFAYDQWHVYQPKGTAEVGCAGCLERDK